MSLLPHWIHIYQRPKQGATFVKRYQATSYEHKINVMGWFDTASCELGISQSEAELIFENYVGNRVAIYVDNPAEPIWEGYISTVTYSAGGLAFRRSMDEMANRVYISYTDGATLVESPSSTVAASQSIYGVKEIGTRGRWMSSVTSPAENITLLRDRRVTEIAYPQTSVTQKSSGNLFIKIEMRGFYDTLRWEKVKTTNNDATASTLLITDALPNLYNEDTFLDNTDFTEIDVPGVTVQSTAKEQSGETVWDVAQNLGEFGDGVDIWIVGVTETKANGKRRMYYRASNKAVEYTARTRDGLRIRNEFGGLLRPWTIKPDRSIRLTDILVGWNAIGDDPRETYIKAISYKQSANAVTWVGEDDVTMEGVMRTFTSQREFKRVFGNRPSRTGT